MSKRILLTGSRAPATLELTRILAKAGFEVYNADSMGSALAGSSRCSKGRFRLVSPRLDLKRYFQQLSGIIQTRAIDVLWPTCEEIFYIAALKPQLEGRCQILAPDLDLILSVHDKYRFSVLAQQNGMRVPPSYLLEKGEPEKRLRAAESWLRENASEENCALVLKPAYSRFASKAVITSRPQLGKDLSRFDPNVGVVLQKFIAGPMICTYSVARRGQLLAHGAYRAQFTEGANASLFFEPMQGDEIDQQVRAFVKALDFTGQIAFDFIEGAAGASVIECNPRLTSGIHLFHNHPDFGRILDPSHQASLQPLPQQPTMMGSAMLAFALKAALSGGYFAAWLSSFLKARDAVFQWRDPLPFLLQPWVFHEFLRVSRRASCSLIEATTADIEWNESQTESRALLLSGLSGPLAESPVAMKKTGSLT